MRLPPPPHVKYGGSRRLRWGVTVLSSPVTVGMCGVSVPLVSEGWLLFVGNDPERGLSCGAERSVIREQKQRRRSGATTTLKGPDARRTQHPISGDRLHLSTGREGGRGRNGIFKVFGTDVRERFLRGQSGARSIFMQLPLLLARCVVVTHCDQWFHVSLS